MTGENNNNTLGGMVSSLGVSGGVSSGISGTGERRKLTKEERVVRAAEREARKVARRAKKDERIAVKAAFKPVVLQGVESLSIKDKELIQATPNNESEGEGVIRKRKADNTSSGDELCQDCKRKFTKEERAIRTAEREARKAARKTAKSEQPVKTEALQETSTEVQPLSKEEKRQQREKKHEERAQNKAVRKQLREDKLQERADKKKRMESVVIEQMPTGDIYHLFLDGNNMMFVADCLRKMTLNRKQRKVERLFDLLTIQYLEALDKKVAKTTLVFDNTPAKRVQRVKETDFELCSARPQFETSDDAIVQWLANIKSTPGVKLCVTSDRGLIERIEKEGGLVMKPKKWMQHAAAVISGHQVESLNDWMNEWRAAQVDM